MLDHASKTMTTFSGVPLASGTMLGRHVILERLGAGTMGVVYAAYDPELGRKVALKLLGPNDASSDAADERRTRLLREAGATARIAHPNVITIHDVGSVGAQVFVAMEFIDGGTLAAWLEQPGRSRRDVLQAFRQAGEGLAAAHSAGLVHGNFASQNVLVGSVGRIRVTDFGIARADEATALSDQRAFSAALDAALSGERRSTAKRNVPTWLRRVLRRGLEAHFPTMRALLDALARGPLVGGRHIVAAVLAAAAIALLAFVALHPSAEPVCRGAEPAWGDLFRGASRQGIRDAFGRAGAAGDLAFAEIDRVLGGYKDEWLTMHRAACEATRVRREQSEGMLDLRMTCLAGRRRAAAALIGLFATADREVVDNAARAVGRLPQVAGCADTTALATRVPPPRDGEERVAVERVDALLAEANALSDVGQPARGLELIAATETPARAAEYEPLIARRLLVRGRLEFAAAKLDEAEITLADAAVAAEAAGDDVVLADGWTQLGRLIGYKRGNVAGGLRWIAYAKAVISRLGGDDELEGNRLNAEAMVLWFGEDRLEEARDLLLRQRALVEKACGASCYKLAELDIRFASLLTDMARPEEAVPVFRRARDVLERAQGPDAPSVMLCLLDEAVALTTALQAAEALPLLERVLETGARVRPGAEDWHVHNRLAETLRRLGRFEDALDADRHALATTRRIYAAGDYAPSWPLTGIGRHLVALGRAKEAIAPLEDAVVLRRKNKVAPEIAETQFVLAEALWDSGEDRARAVTLAREARDGFVADAAKWGGWYRRSMEEIEAWLIAHRLP